MEWTNEPFTVLGVLLSIELKLITSVNFNDRLTDIEKAIAQWDKRNLTVLGKVTVVKTILLSKITHLLISLPSLDTNFTKKLEHILFNYVWGGKTDRISRNKMIKDYKDGGCRMVLQLFIYCYLKIGFICIIKDSVNKNLVLRRIMIPFSMIVST